MFMFQMKTTHPSPTQRDQLFSFKIIFNKNIIMGFS